MTRRIGKTRAIDRHLDRRAGERLGFELSGGTKRELVARIQSGRATFLRRTSWTRTVWRSDIDGVSCIMVYDKTRKQIVTVWRDDP